MRKYLFIMLLLVGSVKAHGQVLISLIFGDALNTGKIEFGLIGGYNWSGISNLESGNYLGTFNLGFFFDIRLTAPWYINTGVLVKSNLGTDKLTHGDLLLLNADIYDEEGEYSQQTKTFMVPVMLKYRAENNFFVEAGVQAGLMYNAWIEFYSLNDGRETTIRQYNKDDLNRLDAGVIVGIGYKLKHKKDNGMSFSLLYYQGLTDVYKNISGPGYSSVFIEATIPIGAD
jgi:hypothetical protein